MKTDIHNRSGREFTLRDGQILLPGRTVSVEGSLADELLKSYPRDIITPDSLRSGPSAQSARDKSLEIARLNDLLKAKDEQIARLTAENQALGELLDEAAKKQKKGS